MEAHPPFDLKVEETPSAGRTIFLFGHLSLVNARQARKEIQKAARPSDDKRLNLNLDGLDYLDSVGAAVLLDVERRCLRDGIEFRLSGSSEAVGGLLSLVDRDALATFVHSAPTKPTSLPTQVGEGTIHLLGDARQILIFVGDVALAMLHLLRHPSSLRWRDTQHEMEQAGADALPIVGLISLLIGLILGFQAVTQLSQFGATLFTANLVGLSVLRELGPLMTCILVAGRSGSAFAAQIGTMQVSEEIAALRTMGFDPVRFLVIPKLIALMVMVPLLTLYADVLGLLGGMFVGTTAGGLTISAYFTQSTQAIGLWDFGQGLIKAEVFAIIITLVGCMRGFQVRGGAAGVGRSTTSAVVTSIFLIIVTDSVFTVLFQYYS